MNVPLEEDAKIDINVPCNLSERASTAEEPAIIRLTNYPSYSCQSVFFFPINLFFPVSVFQLCNGWERY